MKEAFKVQNLSYSFPNWTLQANFLVSPKDRLALVAPSGFGKTSLLKMIAGLMTLQSGKLFYDSQEITNWPIQKREIGFLFQDQRLFSDLSVFENLTFGLDIRKVSKAEQKQILQPWVEQAEIEKCLDLSVGELSGGEKQRIALVRSLIWNPRLILLDEPFTGLDNRIRDQLIEKLIEFHQIHSVPIIFVSHDPLEIERFSTIKVLGKRKENQYSFLGESNN